MLSFPPSGFRINGKWAYCGGSHPNALQNLFENDNLLSYNFKSILDLEQNFCGLTHTKEDVLVLKLAIQRHGVHVLLPSDGHRQHLQNDMLENHRI